MSNKKTKVVVAGATGFIGSQIGKILGEEFDLIGLSRSNRPPPTGYTECRSVDLFSRADTIRALAGAQIGINPVADRERFPFITESGIIIIPKGSHIPAKGPIELAEDIGALLEIDDSTSQQMKGKIGQYIIAQGRMRHSYTSAGPRYEKYREGEVNGFRPDQPAIDQIWNPSAEEIEEGDL